MKWVFQKSARPNKSWTLLDVSLIHFVVSLSSQIKHLLGLSDQRANASTLECVRLCSEGKVLCYTRIVPRRPRNT